MLGCVSPYSCVFFSAFFYLSLCFPLSRDVVLANWLIFLSLLFCVFARSLSVSVLLLSSSGSLRAGVSHLLLLELLGLTKT